MKELLIEEKAKAYDIALDKIKRLLGTGSNCSREELEYVFPELKESEDERIRKHLLEYFNSFTSDTFHNGMSVKDILAWLEKQGGQREQLINKACDVLVNCIEDFMLRRMEIWDEECKKQTLENIRKKLEE